MLYSRTDLESYITEYTLVYEEDIWVSKTEEGRVIPPAAPYLVGCVSFGPVCYCVAFGPPPLLWCFRPPTPAVLLSVLQVLYCFRSWFCKLPATWTYLQDGAVLFQQALDLCVQAGDGLLVDSACCTVKR